MTTCWPQASASRWPSAADHVVAAGGERHDDVNRFDRTGLRRRGANAPSASMAASMIVRAQCRGSCGARSVRVADMVLSPRSGLRCCGIKGPRYLVEARWHEGFLSCGHHLLDRDDGGGLVVTDEFLKAYLGAVGRRRRRMRASPSAHAALLTNPRRPVAAGELAAIADADARENGA